MNYIESFIQVAPNCPVSSGTVPVTNRAKKPVHIIQFELLSQHPYRYTQEDILFEVYTKHKAIPAEELEACGAELRAEFFQKPHPCLRSSALPKKYGWGVYFSKEGKIALYGMETEEYRQFSQAGNSKLKQLFALRNKRAK